MVAAGALTVVGTRAATAAPYTLPALGSTIEVAGPETWTINGTDTWTVVGAGADSMTATSGPKLVLIITVGTQTCAWHAQLSIDSAVITKADDATFEAPASWLPTNWYPAVAVTLSGPQDFRLRRYCRELSSGALTVTVQAPPNDDVSGPVSRVLAALEVDLKAKGHPGISYDVPDPVALLNQKLAEGRAQDAASAAPEVAATLPPYTPPPPVEPYASGDDGSTYDRMSRRPGRYDGVQLSFDYGKVAVEGSALDDGTRFGASLSLPPRLWRTRAKAGWAYGARASVGKIGDALVGDGHGAVGVAGDFGPSTRVALLLLVGYERIVTDSTLATADVPYAGLQIALRFPMADGIAVEGSATALAGEHGRESRYELSLATLYFAPLSVNVGVHRHRWDDGLTLVGVHLGAGY